MRLFVVAALAGGLFAGAAAAQEAAERYVSIAGGWVGSSDYSYALPASGGLPAGAVQADLEAGLGGQVAYGMRYSQNVRFEAALGYRSQDITSRVTYPAPFAGSGGGLGGDQDEHRASAITLDFNAYYDLPITGPVRPYVGAGVGLAQVDLDDGLLSDGGSTANLQAMAGVSLKAGSKATLFVEGRYQRLGTLEVETTNGFTTVQDEITRGGPAVYAGARFSF